MKKTLCIFCFILICTSTLTIISSAVEGNKSLSWYCIRTKDHSRPPLPSEFNIIKEYDGYYLGKDEKIVYLTFDAGYENGNVERTLDVLKEKNVPGAFFILSNLIDKNPELIKRMESEGHLVCNHTSKHANVSLIDDFNKFSSELKTLEFFCHQKTGVEIAKYFRPPEGRFNQTTLKYTQDMGYKTVFWSFAYADWDNNNQMSEAEAKEKILSNIHNGAIILLHPTSKTNAAILGDVIDALKEQGYRFGTLNELT